MIRRCDCDAGRAFSYTERFRWEYKLGVVLRRGKPKNLFGSGVGICRTSHGTRFKLAEMIERPTRHSRCHNPPRHFSSNFLVCRCVARNFSRVLNLSTSRCHASFALYSVIMGTRLGVSTGRKKSWLDDRSDRIGKLAERFTSQTARFAIADNLC